MNYSEAEYIHPGAIAELRVPPHSLEAETSVLGGLMVSNQAWDNVGEMLTDQDFYRREHQLIYAAVGALINACKPADIVTVYTHLENLGKASEVGGLSYLNSLAQYVPSAANIRRYAEIIRERAILRKLVATSDEIATTAFNPMGKDAASIVDEASAKLNTLMERGTGDDWVDTETTVVQFLDRLTEMAEGGRNDAIPTGLTALDEKLNGGMRGGNLIVIGARPSIGKSALAMSIGQHVALNVGLPVGCFSFEMSKEELTTRQISMLSHVHMSKLTKPEWLKDYDWPNITSAVEKLRQVQFNVSETPGLNINQVRNRARKLKREGKLGLLLLDYLQLMSPTNQKDNKNTWVGEITRQLKNLAKELNIPIIVLSQVGREVEKRTTGRLVLSDLRDSGEIEQDADIVIFIDRPHHKNPELGDAWKYYAELNVAKQRNGPTGYIDVRYVGEYVTFLDWGDDPVPKKSSFGGKAL